ncbi:MAG: TraX family protein, partial [Oscillospiraceae bacterium]
MTSFHLKLIAIITMFIDHIGAVLFPYHGSFRLIGRISFVLFAFLLVQGFIHTSNRN